MVAKAQYASEKCATAGCWNKRPHQQGGFLKLCWRCRNIIKKKRNPLRWQFNILRRSAKRRDVPFQITFEEYCEWCRVTGYMEKKGKGKGDMSVGRIDHSKGYCLDNIVMEDYHFNISKRNDHDELPEEPF